MTVVAVLICLIMITLIGGAVLKIGLAERDLVRAQERRLQAEWLAESGARRALAQLAVDPNYTGETYPVSAHELGLPEGTPALSSGASDLRGALVTISVERASSSARRRRIKVQADYPREPSRRARQSKQMLIDLEPANAGVVP
jgi:hypothetical protein